MEEESSPSPASDSSERLVSLEENIDLEAHSSNFELYKGSPVSTVTPTTPARSNEFSKKRKVHEITPYQSKLLGCLEALQKSATEGPRQQDANDEYDYFGKSVAEQIRKLPTAFALALSPCGYGF